MPDAAVEAMAPVMHHHEAGSTRVVKARQSVFAVAPPTLGILDEETMPSEKSTMISHGSGRADVFVHQVLAKMTRLSSMTFCHQKQSQ